MTSSKDLSPSTAKLQSVSSGFAPTPAYWRLAGKSFFGVYLQMKQPKSIYDLPVVVHRTDVMDLLLDQKEEAEHWKKEAEQFREQLMEVRRIANQAMDAYRHGASVLDLHDRFRDVASGARRR